MDSRERDMIADDFAREDTNIRVLICTVAFGMGVDIPDVRYVIHWGESDSALSVWQEIGRAGRDGNKAVSIMCHIGWQLRVCQTSMKDLVATFRDSTQCIRHAILTYLHIPEMGELPGFPHSCNRPDYCHECSCPACECCSLCQRKCKCSSKLISLCHCYSSGRFNAWYSESRSTAYPANRALNFVESLILYLCSNP